MNEITAPYKNNSALVNVMITFSREAAFKFYDGLKNGELKTDIPDIFELTPNNSLLRFEAKIGAHSDSGESGFHYDLVLGNLPTTDSGDAFESRLFQHYAITRRSFLRLYEDNVLKGDMETLPSIYLCWGYGTDAETWSTVHKGLITDIEYDFTPNGDKVLKVHMKDSLSLEMDALALRKSASQVSVEVDFGKSIHWNLSNLLSKFLSNAFTKSYVVVNLGEAMETYLTNWEDTMKSQSYSSLLAELDTDDSGAIDTDKERAAVIERLKDLKSEHLSTASRATIERDEMIEKQRNLPSTAEFDTRRLELERGIDEKNKIINEALYQAEIIDRNLEDMFQKSNQNQDTITNTSQNPEYTGLPILNRPNKVTVEKPEHSSGIEPINLKNLYHPEQIERFQRITQNLLPNANLLFERGVLESRLPLTSQNNQSYHTGNAIAQDHPTGPSKFIHEEGGKMTPNPNYVKESEPDLPSDTGGDNSENAFNSLPHKFYFESAGIRLENVYDGEKGIGHLKGATLVEVSHLGFITFKNISAEKPLSVAKIFENNIDGPAANAYYRYLLMRKDHENNLYKYMDRSTLAQTENDKKHELETRRQAEAQKAAEGKTKDDTRKVVYFLKLHKPRGVSLREYIFGTRGDTGKRGSKGLIGDMQTMYTATNPNTVDAEDNEFNFIGLEISKDNVVPEKIVESGLTNLCYFGDTAGYSKLITNADTAKDKYFHPNTSYRKVYSLACTSNSIGLNEEGAVSLTPVSKDLVFTFGRKGVDIQFDEGALTSIVQDPVILDLKYNLNGQYYLSLFSTPVKGVSTVLHEPGTVPSSSYLLSKLGSTFAGDKDKIIKFLLDWTSQTGEKQAEDWYKGFLGQVMSPAGEIIADEYGVATNAHKIEQFQKDTDTIAAEISRVVTGDQFSDRISEGLGIVFGLSRQPDSLKNKRWFATADNSFEFNDAGASFEHVLIPTSNEELYIDGDPTSDDDENSLLRMQAAHFARISTMIHSLTITIPGLPELSTITELMGENGRRILVQVYNHRTGTHHWLSGKYGLYGITHNISASKGYTTQLRLFNKFENIVGGAI
tara:strand:+ start:482 stop:3688 length:3207 start_codon:yes stop_codon:yes gene_type:complete